MAQAGLLILRSPFHITTFLLKNYVFFYINKRFLGIFAMALSKFLDPKNDVAFRHIFGTEKNKDILIHFINDILSFTGKNAIQDIEFLSTIQDPDIASKKQSILDVLCRDSTGVQWIIEIQLARTVE